MCGWLAGAGSGRWTASGGGLDEWGLGEWSLGEWSLCRWACRESQAAVGCVSQRPGVGIEFAGAVLSLEKSGTQAAARTSIWEEGGGTALSGCSAV